MVLLAGGVIQDFSPDTTAHTLAGAPRRCPVDRWRAWRRSRPAPTNSGAHGLSEVFYAYAPAANNNGSAAGLTVMSPFFQLSLGAAMLVGRLLPVVLVLALAGSLAESAPVPVTAGTLPTTTPLFVTLLVVMSRPSPQSPPARTVPPTGPAGPSDAAVHRGRRSRSAGSWRRPCPRRSASSRRSTSTPAR